MIVRKDETLLNIDQKKNKKVTNCLMFNTVVDWLQEISPEFQEHLKILDYYQPPTYDEQELVQWNDCMDVQAVVNPGGSEGVYIDWFWSSGKKDDKPVCIGTFKTLEEGLKAFEAMGAIAGMLTYASWRFINRNWDLIKEEK